MALLVSFARRDAGKSVSDRKASFHRKYLREERGDDGLHPLEFVLAKDYFGEAARGGAQITTNLPKVDCRRTTETASGSSQLTKCKAAWRASSGHSSNAEYLV